MCCGVDCQKEEESLDVETTAVFANQTDEVTDMIVQEFEVGNLAESRQYLHPLKPLNINKLT